MVSAPSPVRRDGPPWWESPLEPERGSEHTWWHPNQMPRLLAPHTGHPGHADQLPGKRAKHKTQGQGTQGVCDGESPL